MNNPTEQSRDNYFKSLSASWDEAQGRGNKPATVLLGLACELGGMLHECRRLYGEGALVEFCELKQIEHETADRLMRVYAARVRGRLNGPPMQMMLPDVPGVEGETAADDFEILDAARIAANNPGTTPADGDPEGRELPARLLASGSNVDARAGIYKTIWFSNKEAIEAANTRFKALGFESVGAVLSRLTPRLALVAGVARDAGRTASEIEIDVVVRDRATGEVLYPVPAEPAQEPAA